MLVTKDENEEEQIYVCENQEVIPMTREEYKKNYGAIIA
jgi:hypothetical protein